MPINSTRGAGSAKGFGLTVGGNAPIDFDYLIVAGGGAANGFISGGGGAGGVRTSFPGGTKITLKGGDNDITVGAGGVFVPANPRAGGKGVDSSVAGLTTITSAGGGTSFARGAVNPGPVNDPANQAIRDGGSGSGLGHRGFDGDNATTGQGNTPPTSPSQGNPGGGSGPNNFAGSGGGGASNAGGAGSAGGPGSNAGDGGTGVTSNISGSPVTRGGGGGGGAYIAGGSNGGLGGGGDGGSANNSGTPGGTNFGGGGGGSGSPDAQTTGGSGIVILRCPSARVFTVSPGTNTITTEPASGDQIATFTVTGKLKAIK